MQLKIPYMSKILQFYDASGEKKSSGQISYCCLPAFLFFTVFFQSFSWSLTVFQSLKLYPALLRPRELQPTRLLCPRNFPGKNILEWLPFPSPGDLPDPGIEPVSPSLAGGFFTLRHQGSHHAQCSINLTVFLYN